MVVTIETKKYCKIIYEIICLFNSVGFLTLLASILFSFYSLRCHHFCVVKIWYKLFPFGFDKILKAVLQSESIQNDNCLNEKKMGDAF